MTIPFWPFSMKSWLITRHQLLEHMVFCKLNTYLKKKKTELVSPYLFKQKTKQSVPTKKHPLKINHPILCGALHNSNLIQDAPNCERDIPLCYLEIRENTRHPHWFRRSSTSKMKKNGPFLINGCWCWFPYKVGSVAYNPPEGNI